ncbi:MAG: V-type ATP synthase subunit D [Oscillospiraceae bacterium]|nr:V-type ATP synthase subunit D [Oscillospiraceae bacterium]
MAEQIFPTKGNLIKTKRQLAQAAMGYELMDRKRNILVREMVTLVDEAKELRSSIESTYSEAYKSLERANTATGFAFELAQTIPVENSLKLTVKSVMGVELPKIVSEIEPPTEPAYPMHLTNPAFDDAFMSFNKVKVFTVRLAEVENDIYRLANGIIKTQKRANALKNIIIPKFREQLKFISNALEEKEREEFSRQKVIKRRKVAK